MAGVVGWRVVKVISHPAANMTNEGDVGERSSGCAIVEEVRHFYAAETRREVSCISAMSGERTELVIASDHRHGGGDECCLGEGNGEADAPVVHGHVLAQQPGAGVLLDAQQAVEGEHCRAPVSGVGEDVEVEAGADGTQAADGEAAGGLAVVGVAVPVEEAGPDAVERAAAREVGEAHAHGVVGDGGDKAGEAGDAVLLGVDDADTAQLKLCERHCGVDPNGSTDGVEGALS